MPLHFSNYSTALLNHANSEIVTTSTLWGSSKAAAFRAVNVEHITEENEQLVRTWHPAFASLDKVYVSESQFGGPVWLVGSPVNAVEAGGRPILSARGPH